MREIMQSFASLLRDEGLREFAPIGCLILSLFIGGGILTILIAIAERIGHGYGF